MAQKCGINGKRLLGCHYNKRLMGFSDGDKLMYQEIYKLATGTDITITDTKDDQGRISGFECASTQLKSYFNALLNSNFVNTTGWSGSLCSWSVTNNELTMLATLQSGRVQKGFTPISGHKYYISGQLKTDSPNVGLRIYDGVSFISSPYHTGNNQYQRVSAIGTSNNNASGYVQIRDDRTSGWANVYAKQMIFIDLTAQYGAGNEPTLTWCDANITYDKCWAMDIPNTIYSSGDGGVLNVWGHKKNFFDKSKYTTGSFNTTNGIRTTNAIQTYLISLSYIPVTSTTIYYAYDNIEVLDIVFGCYDQNYNFLGWIRGNGTVVSLLTNTKYISNRITYVADLKLTLSYESMPTYEAYTGAEYPITLPVGYLGGSLPNGVKDTDISGKLSKSIFIGGSENWATVWTNGTNTMAFYINNWNLAKADSDSIVRVICDKFKGAARDIPTNNYNSDVEQIIIGGTTTNRYIAIRINKSRLATQDVAGFKNWLASNNVTVQYELATPIDVSSSIVKPQISTYKDYCKIESTNAVKANLTTEYLEK